jgi:SAM-dependent methyltransferase
MGSRSGEEQLLFVRNLVFSNVLGVELEPSANSIENTIIADIHNLNMISSSSQDFIYSNSHDQSNNILRAIEEWLRLLKPSGLLLLEHSRAHGKLRVGSQDPCGMEQEILPFIFMLRFQNQISLECILTPDQQ